MGCKVEGICFLHEIKPMEDETMKMIVDTRGLSKTYGSRHVVQDLDLKVPEGCVYGLMGPNGAGKSTTMKMLLGLIKRSNGRVFIDGKEMNEKNRLAVLRETGSLIEQPSYYGHLTGRENLEIVQTLKGVSSKRIDEVLRLVRLETQQNKKVREYSQGMKQRLGLAEALIGGLKLLILDEPTNALDPAGIQEIRELICDLPRRMGITVLISSHLLNEIDQMADYVGIINHGQLIFQDKLEVLREHSQNSILLKAINGTATQQILKAQNITYSMQEDGILIPAISNGKLSELIVRLVYGGAGIYRVEECQKSLEEIFLSLTGRRGSL